MQIRNQIMLGIAQGTLRPGERLPALRTLAEEAGINMMTVNKAYALLRQEGFIRIDRRSGATICAPEAFAQEADMAALREQLRLIISQARLKGIAREEFIAQCEAIFTEQEGKP